MNMKKLGKRVRYIWHEFYYFFATKKMVNVAMTCQSVVEEIDIKKRHRSTLETFRFKLHLSLCQYCKNYSDTSREITNVMKQLANVKNNNEQLDKLNQELIELYVNQNQNKQDKNE